MTRIEINQRELERAARAVVSNGAREAQRVLDAVYRQRSGKSVEEIERMLTRDLRRTSIEWKQDQVKGFARTIAAGTPIRLSTR